MPTILITGASGGLAQEMVKLLQNDQLILLGRNKEKLAQLYGNYPHAELIEIDITDDSALESLVTDLYLRYGKIDVLINNAGYGIFEEFDQISDQDIHQMFEVNTFALMNLSRRLASRMKESRKGHIINIVSMAGLIATGKSSLYSATKFAANWFFKCSAPRTHVLQCLCNDGQSRTNPHRIFLTRPIQMEPISSRLTASC